MRKKLMLMAVLCLSAAWLMAQAPTSSGAPAGSSGQSTTQSAPAGQPASPGAQSGAAGQSAPGAVAGEGSDMAIVHGCLGGSNPNYTLTDTKGTTYKLVTPPAADVSVLAKHIGEPIAVMGKVNDAGASSGSSAKPTASASGVSGAASSQPNIQVARIGRGSGNCPASSGATSPKPPAKNQ